MILHLCPHGLIMCLLPQGNVEQPRDAQNEFRITVPTTLKRCGIETKLILSSSKGEQPHARTLNALRKALQWQEAFTSGKIPSLSAIARQENVTQRRIAHLNLTLISSASRCRASKPPAPDSR